MNAPLRALTQLLSAAAQSSRRQRLIAAVGALVGLLMILMKVVPFVPGHFSIYEWLALGIWIVLGAIAARHATL